MKNFHIAHIAFALLLGVSQGGCGPATSGSESTPHPKETATSLVAVSEVVKLQTISPKLSLSGQVNPTEEGTVAVTTPLDGVVVRPLIRVGDYVQKDQPLAELNNLFGQTPLQILSQLETYQTAAMEAQKNLVTNQTALAQARTALGQAYAAVSAAQSALGQAQAELAASRSDLRRKKELVAAGVFSQADLDEAQDRYGKAAAVERDTLNQIAISKRLIPFARASVAQLDSAIKFGNSEVQITRLAYERSRGVLTQSNLVGASIPPELAGAMQGGGGSSASGQAGQFTIRSPISGIVSDLSMSPGLKITSGTAVGNVTDIRQVYVDANAFDNDVASLKVGDTLECVSMSYPNRKFRGHIKYISRRVQSDTRAIVVRSLIDNPQGLLRPSMFVKTEIDLPSRSNVISIPDTAVLTEGDETYAVVETDNHAYNKQKISIGVQWAGRTEIRSGLKPGDRVITQGNLLLDIRDGQK